MGGSFGEGSPEGGSHYLLLEPTRLCAMERRGEAAADAICPRDAVYYLAFAERARSGMRGGWAVLATGN